MVGAPQRPADGHRRRSGDEGGAAQHPDDSKILSERPAEHISDHEIDRQTGCQRVDRAPRSMKSKQHERIQETNCQQEIRDIRSSEHRPDLCGHAGEEQPGGRAHDRYGDDEREGGDGERSKMNLAGRAAECIRLTR